MKAGVHINEHWNDANNNPAGGCTSGNGFAISWQNGQLGRGEERKEPNGIVCFHVAANTGFKKTIERDEEPKSSPKASA